MTEEIYARQEPLGIIRDQTVLVVGCGGVGAWVGYFLGLAGVQRLHLFDSDTISDTNLNRLPFTPEHIGRYKSEALAELIRKARPDVDVKAYGNFDPEYHAPILTEPEGKWNPATVVSTDSLKSRKMVYDAVVATGKSLGGYLPYYELGADGMGASISGAPAEWSSDLEDQPGYQSVPVFVGPCTFAASVASYYILRRKTLEDTIRADWSDGLQIKQYVGV
jgi:molybdopterin/thiamine biosynthesis adenylyltransferase